MAATWYFAFGVLTLVSAALLYLVRVSERALDELHTLAQRHKAPHAEAHRV
jgi:hypothetical protein